MSRRLLNWYQYLAPAILTPLSFWLWWQEYTGNLYLLSIAWLLPILYAYIVPGIGTNVFKVWEFDTRLRLGRFRPHHGFVFGSATSMLAWLCHGDSAESLSDVVIYAFILASVLGFWNIIYDIRAIQSGLLKVYNQPWADGKNAAAITMDYAPWFFASFGMVYGAAIGFSELWAANRVITMPIFSAYFVCVLVISMAVPVVGYRNQSMRRHGHYGCCPVEKRKS
ncbi:MAG: hypothetical protein AB2805_18495 [Candidatus Thiodiazotropha sp.]